MKFRREAVRFFPELRLIGCICAEENRCASQACHYNISGQNAVVCHLCASAMCSGFPGKVNLHVWARKVRKQSPTDGTVWGSGLGSAHWSAVPIVSV